MTKITIRFDRETQGFGLYLGNDLHKLFRTEKEADEAKKRIEGQFVRDHIKLQGMISTLDVPRNLSTRWLAILDRFIAERVGMDREGVVEMLAIAGEELHKVIDTYLEKEDQ
jgi:hypothetical protein